MAELLSAEPAGGSRADPVLSRASLRAKKEMEAAKKEERRKRKRALERQILKTQARVRPEVLLAGEERTLRRVATRGVVQLFSLIREQQELARRGGETAAQEFVEEEPQSSDFVALLQDAATSKPLDDPKARNDATLRHLLHPSLFPVKSEPVDETRIKLEHVAREAKPKSSGRWSALRDDWLSNR